MLRDLLIGGDQLRVLEQRPAAELWRIALAWSGAGLVAIMGAMALLPVEMEWGPYLVAGGMLAGMLLLGWTLVSLVAVYAGRTKAGGAKKQLPLLVAGVGMAMVFWAACVAISFVLLRVVDGEWAVLFTVFAALAGVVGANGIFLLVWTHLLKTPFWLAVPLAAFLGGGIWAGAHAVWALLIDNYSDFAPMLLL